MDREHFDAITRLFATKRSRRLALAALAGTALLHLGPAGSLAKRKHKRRRKDHRTRGSAGLCTPLENVCIPNAGRDCCPNTKCVKPFPYGQGGDSRFLPVHNVPGRRDVRGTLPGPGCVL